MRRAGLRQPRLLSIRSVDAGRIAVDIEAELRGVGDPARAEHEKRYLKSDIDHFGVAVPAIGRIAKGGWTTFRRFAATTS